MVKIPEGASCVFTGQKFKIFQWQQKQFDDTYRTFECAKRFDSVQGIVVEGDMICLPEELQPGWTTRKMGMRGGVLEEGEIPMEAIQREFVEETGCEAECTYWITLGSTGYVNRDEHVYILRNLKKVQEPTWEAGEDIKKIYMNFDEFIQTILNPTFRNKIFVEYIVRNYILTNKQEELKKILFLN